MDERSQQQNTFLRGYDAQGQECDYERADLGARAYAFCWDVGLRLGLLAVVNGIAMILGSVWLGEGLLAWWKQQAELPLLLLVSCFLIWVGYAPFLEYVWQGQTVGKKIAGIQVRSQRGKLPTLYSVLVRHIACLIDGLPGTYAVGIVSILLSKDRLRLGDVLANTAVVYTAQPQALQSSRIPTRSLSLDLEKKQYLTELLQRWESMPLERRCKMAMQFLESLDLPSSKGLLDERVDKGLHARLITLSKEG